MTPKPLYAIWNWEEMKNTFRTLKYRHTFFFHCVCCIWDELACLWGRLCMVTLHCQMMFKPHADMIICGLRIFVKTKWLRSQASGPCLLVLTVQALNAHALTPDGGKDLRMR